MSVAPLSIISCIFSGADGVARSRKADETISYFSARIAYSFRVRERISSFASVFLLPCAISKTALMHRLRGQYKIRRTLKKPASGQFFPIPYPFQWADVKPEFVHGSSYRGLCLSTVDLVP
jgi:hypothetical protein